MYFELTINGKTKVYQYAKNVKKAAEKALKDKNTNTIALYMIRPECLPEYKKTFIPWSEYYKICACKNWFYYLNRFIYY